MNDIVIIGGGISGLYILEQLSSKYSNMKIKLIERDNRLGGRIWTKYYRSGHVKFETGPWRFHHSHHKLIKLLHQYNLKYKQNSSSHSKSYQKSVQVCSQKKPKTNQSKKNPKAGLSYRDMSLLENKTCLTQQKENLSKIPLVMDSTSKPYDVNLSYEGCYYVVEQGFSELISRISEKLHQYIQTNCLVENVIKNKDSYQITLRRRIGNTYQQESIKCKCLFLCLPPKECLQWSIIQDNLLPLVHSVGTIPLHHIYGYSRQISNFHENKFYLKNDTEISQIISGDFNNNWFQISYSAGENARFFYRLKQAHPGLFNKVLKSKLKELGINIPVSKIESFYWEEAIHYWKPAFKFKIMDSMKGSVYPHPINLPNLFYAGEAFSTIQGWIEGSLETSQLALDAFEATRSGHYIFRPISIPKSAEYVILDNRYLDVKQWKMVHPGSTAAINNHLGEDISKLFRHIKHSHYSWAVVNHIQKYWVLGEKIGNFELKKKTQKDSTTESKHK